MNPEEIRTLAEVLEKVPGAKAIDMKDVKKLVELLRESPEIGSIELKGFLGTGVVVTRTNGGFGGMAMPLPMPMGAPVPVAAPAAPASPAAAEAAAAPSASLKEIRSPMVGTFYAAPEPGAESYVKVGARVTPGRTVCIIEAMKIMNEIEAEFGGVIREVCVDDAQPVEFGQVLFRVDPNG
ncbi:MAG: acetyl-CoA carboxylase biotin carboxyl carrier protein [Gemmatimonadales bacterium]